MSIRTPRPTYQYSVVSAEFTALADCETLPRLGETLHTLDWPSMLFVEQIDVCPFDELT